MDKAEIQQGAQGPKQTSEDQRSSWAHPIPTGPIKKHRVENKRNAVGRQTSHAPIARQFSFSPFQRVGNLPFLLPESAVLKLLAKLKKGSRIVCVSDQFQVLYSGHCPKVRKRFWFEDSSVEVSRVDIRAA
jgi:hypothetical protein